jgi:hypothetical protein
MSLRPFQRANGGYLARSDNGSVWFVLDPNVHRRLMRRNGRTVERVYPANQQNLVCNRTPPILAPLGGFRAQRNGVEVYCWVRLPQNLKTMFWDRDSAA